ncbi:MAG: ABC transporter ATP-binding protein [Reichenbachiella sp.]|uniref:ABC transporter ATP-binding protein n=1 Tax=Reichenbachiella sp. TaxID=2184521 RepID=UPI003264AD31
MIEIENIKKRFDRLQVLNGVSLTIDKPGIFAILGPNGSGKTTLLKSILGMVLPQSGNILLNGTSTLGEWQYRKQIGYLPQIARFPDNLSVAEVIAMIKTIRDQPADEKPLITRFGLDDSLAKKLGNLSGGTRQKVNIVLTFMFDCQLYILDEPTAGLDPVALIQLKELIKEEQSKGKTFLITTHIMNLVEELSDEIVFLLDGKIYFKGSLEALKEKTGQDDLEHAIAQILK